MRKNGCFLWSVMIFTIVGLFFEKFSKNPIWYRREFSLITPLSIMLSRMVERIIFMRNESKYTDINLQNEIESSLSGSQSELFEILKKSEEDIVCNKMRL